jgi:hypothetical protein
MLFRLSEYDRAGRIVFFWAADALIDQIEPALAAFPRVPVDAVPISRITINEETTLRIKPEGHETMGSFDTRRIVAGDIDAVLEEIDRVATEEAPKRLAFVQGMLQDVTSATGQVVRAGPVSWQSLMTVIERAPIAFDANDQPTFLIWPPQAAAAYEALPPRTPEQEKAWQALMARKLEEHRARRGPRKLA